MRPIKENDRRNARAFQGSLMQRGRIIAAVFIQRLNGYLYHFLPISLIGYTNITISNQ